jgi:hypothetical protein
MVLSLTALFLINGGMRLAERAAGSIGEASFLSAPRVGPY